MTTSTLPTQQANGISAFLARNIRTIVRIDAVVTTVAALEMILFPDFFVSAHGLGASPIWAVRWLGAEWLIFGLWLLTLWNRPLTRGMASFAITILGINAVFLIVAPLAFGLGFSPIGWALTIGTVIFMDIVSLGWWQVLSGRTDGTSA